MGGYSNKSKVLVVHCVDTEGPIGGDVRRHPDGSKEFMDNWEEIKNSLNDITNDEYRMEACDSYGNPLKFNWFIMDFTGFKTNPKNRVATYNDTYDNIKSLNTRGDSFHWHYHQPPKSGIGDQWSDDWGSSLEHYNILGSRLLDRQDFPEVFRAGGTVEDNKCSGWLENNLMIDYSNRVSYRSEYTEDINDFNWHSAPPHWGYYHPSHENLLEPGMMRRYVVRCVDLMSRLHELQRWEVEEAFKDSMELDKPVILSYFSHDHRDMRHETQYVVELIKSVSEEYDIPFEWSDAKKALQESVGLRPTIIEIGFENKDDNMLMITFKDMIYQKNPFVYTRDALNNIRYHKLDLEYIPNCPYYLARTYLKIEPSFMQVGVACTSMSGDKSIKILDLK